jgi:DNA invertase Pin-like site-specific DNA recombinase
MATINAYLRVSGKKQIDGHGFSRQLDAVKRYCRKQGLKIDKVFKEQVSGTKDETERKEFSAMVSDMLANGCETIVVEDLSRLAREYRIQEQMLIYLASKDLTLINASSGENVTQAIAEDPLKKALIQMQGIFAELDKSLLVKKLRKGRERKRREENWREGPDPYGSTPAEAAVLKRIRYARRLNRGQYRRRTYQSIADELNAEGIRTRQGKRWNAALVYNVLRKRKRR